MVLARRITIHEGIFARFRQKFRPGSFDLVISNPPYRRLRSGRLNPDGQRAIARHELKSSLADVFGAARHLLDHGGRLASHLSGNATRSSAGDGS